MREYMIVARQPEEPVRHGQPKGAETWMIGPAMRDSGRVLHLELLLRRPAVIEPNKFDQNHVICTTPARHKGAGSSQGLAGLPVSGPWLLYSVGGVGKLYCSDVWV